MVSNGKCDCRSQVWGTATAVLWGDWKRREYSWSEGEEVETDVQVLFQVLPRQEIVRCWWELRGKLKSTSQHNMGHTHIGTSHGTANWVCTKPGEIFRQIMKLNTNFCLQFSPPRRPNFAGTIATQCTRTKICHIQLTSVIAPIVPIVP